MRGLKFYSQEQDSFVLCFSCCKRILKVGPAVGLTHEEMDDFLLANNL